MPSPTSPTVFLSFFFNDPPSTEISTLSLHDALPISATPQARWPTSTRPRRHTASRRSSPRSEEHTSELQSHSDLVCRLLLEKKKLEQFLAENDLDVPELNDELEVVNVDLEFSRDADS